MDLIRWSQDLEEDLEVLEWLKDASAKVTANKDAKLLDLKKLLRAKYGHPINGNNKKVIIFTAFADTANYLYEHLASIVKARHGLNSALITGGAKSNQSTMPGVNVSDMNDILTNFLLFLKEEIRLILMRLKKLTC